MGINSQSLISKIPSKSWSIPILLVTFSACALDPLVKIIFTNGSRAHALNVTKRIGIDRLFDGIFDIRDCEFIPKPSKEPYKKLVENYKIEPQYCIFFEDIARNLKPAHELGMKTVWIKNNEPWAARYSDEDFINYKTDNLAKFLKEINELR